MVKPDPLADIDSLDWSVLEHAYGPAADVPDTLRRLQSPDQDTRTSAYNQLYSGIYHQGSRYSASAAAVPFLYKLLNAPDTPQRENIVRLLVNLAVGDTTHYWLRGLDVTQWREDVAEFQQLDYCERRRQERAKWIEDAPTDMERKKREFEALMYGEPEAQVKSAIEELQTYDAVKKEIGSIIALLKSDSAAIRLEAAFAVGWFAEDTDKIHSALFELLDSEKNVIIQATALVSLGSLQTRSTTDLSESPVVRRLRSIFSESETAVFVRFAAAVALLQLHCAETDHVSKVVRKLTDQEYLQEYEPRNLEDIPFPFADPNLISMAAMALANLGEGEDGEALKSIVTAIPPSRGETTLILANMGLQMAFKNERPEERPEFSSLTETHKELIVALTKVDEFNWRFANFSAVLRAWKVPTNLDQLKTYADIE